MNSKIIEFSGTPESGKTTLINNVYEKLQNKGLKVKLISEVYSRGKLKNWNHFLSLRTAVIVTIMKETIESKFQEYELILVDRGLYDRLLFNDFDLLRERINEKSHKEVEQFIKYFINNNIYNTALLINLTVSPEEAIKRKGNEGSFTNIKSVTGYNKVFNKHINNLDENLKTIKINTENREIEQLTDEIINNILNV